MKDYLIGDFNGGSRYKVEVDDVSILVSKKEKVHASETHIHSIKKYKNTDLNRTLVKYTNRFKPVWCGDLSGKHIYDTLNNELSYDPRSNPFREHNTLLIDIGNNRYMHVGDELYIFKTLNGEKILHYYSPMRLGASPYPYAVGENNTYLMFNNAIIPNNSYSETPLKDPQPYAYTTIMRFSFIKIS
jgi:hypothetical protein